jgi:hypothetical protein
LTNSKDLVYCGPFLTITTLVITNGCFYVRHKPIKQDVGENFICYTQQTYSSII